MKIGILALQGAFIEHQQMLEELRVTHFLIRNLEDFLQPMDGIILPGGESTAILKMLYDLQIFEPLKSRILSGFPVFGTCAGLILLAKNVSNDSRRGFQTMDITIKRNAYGRQLSSFKTIGNFESIGHVPMTFIRAPLVESNQVDVHVLAQVDGGIVAVRQGNQLGTTFHPELDDDLRIHQYFLEIVSHYMNK
jgi:pyridoxal 5'-phosphate synthase pdxT subunit